MSVLTGCAYYPEQWPKEYWPNDARMMREVGLSVVRLAEFAWDKMEPSAGVYDFDWLEEAIQILASEGLKIVLCTPTPTPPPWLTHLYPDILRVNEHGIRISPGARRQPCGNVPAFQEYAFNIVARIAERFGQHPAVIGWQIDNEFGVGQTTRCYCDHCRRRFHEWLREKYGTLDTLNAAWGTQFWGMTYRDWAHIPIPGITTEPQNPSMLLDYRRFSSNTWERFQRRQIEILRPLSPGRWITHNFMIRHWSLDYWKLAEDLDFVSYDNYPHGMSGPIETALNLDLMHSFKRQTFWVMEQQPGPVNWHLYNPPVPDGQVRLWSHQAVAHGASAIIYFRFRAGRTGQEQYHRGLLKWDNSPDQSYYESQQVSREVSPLPSFTRPQAKVGIIYDYSDLWAIELEPYNRDFSYYTLVNEIYAGFWKHNIAVDFLPRGADLTGYETVIVPAPILIHPGEVEKWQKWVEQGGRLIYTFRSYVRHASNIATACTLPVGLADLIGARVLDYYSVPPESYTEWPSHRLGKHVQQTSGAKSQFAYKIWVEVLESSTARPLLIYSDGRLANQVGATVNTVGSGEAFYIGCWPEDFAALLEALQIIPDASESIKLGALLGDDGFRWQVEMNHTDTPTDSLSGYDARYTRIDG
ncbi:MAG: beta-galactosidase [Anaerolineae bacterium]|nr:beta-galactosidase [Anaerolineae bacterium]